MTEAAAASGAANDATAITGPPMPAHMELAVRLADYTAATENVGRMEAKLTKAQDAAKDMVATARAGLADAKAAEREARKAVGDLTGERGQAALEALRTAADEARAQADAAQALIEGEGG